MKKTVLNRVLSVICAVMVAVLVITFSIGLPIYVRPFYYVQIDLLGMPEDTGYDYDTIKAAYDEVLDYLTLPGRQFGTGELKYSEVGEGHFADCRALFDLNLAAFVISLGTVLVLFILNRRGIIRLCSPFGFGPGFFAGASTLSVFALLGIIVSLDFNTAFTVFHTVFFPGKDNWIFNPSKDEIIKVMPQQFFMNCAILIASSIIIISLALIIHGILARKRAKNKSEV